MYTDAATAVHRPVSRPAQSYPAQSYPAQSYPAQSYPAQSYPAQSYPAQSYPAELHPTQSYPAQSYPAQSYAAQSIPTQSSPAQSYPAWSGPAPARPPVPRFAERTQLAAAHPVAGPRIRPAVSRPKHRWLGLTVRILVATGVILGVVLGGFWFVEQRDAGSATLEVGTCLARTGTSGIADVGCGDPAAQFKVVGRVDDRTEAQASTACAGVRGVVSTYWKGERGSTGTVLCLAVAG